MDINFLNISGIIAQGTAAVGNKYLFAAILMVVYYFIYKVPLLLIRKGILKLTEKTKSDLDDRIIYEIESPVSFIFFVIGLHLIIFPLELFAPEILDKITYSFIVAIVAWILIVLIDILLEVFGKKWAKKTKSTIDDAVLPLIRKMQKVVIGIVAFLFIMSTWEVNVSGLLAGLGIAGIALGFAVKDSLGNIFGGIALILDKAIKVGDVVELDSGESGEVLDVGLRSTRIKTWDNELLIVPNGVLVNTTIKNYKLPNKKARANVEFGVGYGTDHKKVKKIIGDILKKNKEVMGDPAPSVRFDNMGDSSINFKAFFWVEQVSERVRIKEGVICDIYDALNKAKIDIPFPTRTVFMHKGK